MINQYKRFFLEVAEELHRWIGLRCPNATADKWIKNRKCLAKMLECKAKTADKIGFKFAGLVVDPNIYPEGFIDLSRAKEKWEIFMNSKEISKFEIVKQGEDKGLVKYKNQGIHAEYDLLSICKADAEGNFMFTGKDMHGLLALEVKRRLNQKIGKEMIQHGTEYEYEGIGANHGEEIYWFGSGNQFKLSNMHFDPTKFELRKQGVLTYKH